jgi:hypothetical protein
VLGHSLSRPILISYKVWTYKMLRLLPLSINTLENHELPMTRSTTKGH